MLACDESLCGYALKTGEKILINMKPQDSKWIGRIHDPDSGRNYDSTIALKGANTLRVQGCAFGGMFCGGQIWNRVRLEHDEVRLSWRRSGDRPLLPLPALRGERVGVRGSFGKFASWKSPPHPDCSAIRPLPASGAR